MRPSTMNGDLPLRVRTFTMPLLRSPYSTDGMPVTISTLSTLAVLTVRVGAARVSSDTALLSSLMPSTSMAVPNEALPFSCEPLRRARRLSLSSEPLAVLPPGSSELMSARSMIC